MSRIRRIDAPGYPRHLGIRGVDGMACFRSDKDRHVFLCYLREAIEKGGCSLHAFVLMTNWNSPAFPDTSIMPKWQQEVWNGNQGETEFHA